MTHSPNTQFLLNGSVPVSCPSPCDSARGCSGKHLLCERERRGGSLVTSQSRRKWARGCHFLSLGQAVVAQPHPALGPARGLGRAPLLCQPHGDLVHGQGPFSSFINPGKFKESLCPLLFFFSPGLSRPQLTQPGHRSAPKYKCVWIHVPLGKQGRSSRGNT